MMPLITAPLRQMVVVSALQLNALNRVGAKILEGGGPTPLFIAVATEGAKVKTNKAASGRRTPKSWR